jgi:hypothetical protein
MATAVAELYGVFAQYPLRAPVEGCPHCVSPEYQALLEAQPLREIDAEHLDLYASKAMTTWGCVDDFRHFLPRILDLAALGQLGVWLATVTGKLRYAEWRTWPVEEQQAIETYLMALWRRTLGRYAARFERAPGPYSAEDVLVALAAADDEMQPFLEEWDALARQTEAAVAHLAEFITDISGVPYLGRRGLSINGLIGEPKRQVCRWLLSDVPARHLEDAFFGAVDLDDQERLSAAVTCLEAIRAVLSSAR